MEHNCKQESHLGMISARLDGHDKIESKLEASIIRLMELHNNDGIGTKDQLNKLTINLGEMSILLSKVNEQNGAIVKSQEKMTDQITNINLQINSIQSENKNTRFEIETIKDNMNEGRAANKIWQDTVDRRMSKLERISYFIYSGGLILYTLIQIFITFYKPN